MRTHRSLVLLGVLVCALPVEAALPPGFVDEAIVTTGTGGPTDIAFTGDGRMLVTRQAGTLRVYNLSATPAPLLGTALTFGSGGAPALCSNFERGLLGVEVDPLFEVNRHVYLFYTFNKFGACPQDDPTNASNPVNRVSRFTLLDTNTIDPASEVVLIDNIRSPNGNHNGGDLAFGKDGFLYVATGDGGADYAGNSGGGGSNDAARDRFQLIGKILRVGVNANGTTFIPATNPFQGAGTARCNVTGETTAGTICQETFAWGLRNPFRFAMDPNAAGTRFFVNDVGQGQWEEIDLGQSGADYGWNCREGAHTNNTSGPCNPTPPAMVEPIFEYQHDNDVPGTSASGCNSITGGAFVPNGLWPGYDGAYIFSDFVCGWMFRLSAGAPYGASDFATNLGDNSAVSLQFGPLGVTGQALYYTTFAGGGQVRRISYAFDKGDLSNDHRPDLLLRNAVGNEHRIWVMNGVVRTGDVVVSPGPISPSIAVGVDDFNDDGRGDLVYHNTATGAVQFQMMNGTATSGAPVALTGAAPLPTNWSLAATGDFNADGDPDLVWRNATSQLLVIWTMNGTDKTGNIAPTPDHAADANWRLVATLDFDRDGNRDLLWYNVTSGRAVQWLMNAAVVRTVGRFTNPMSAGDANWKVVAGGDFGAGPSGLETTNDIVWRNDTSGRYVVWYLDLAGNRTAGTFTNPMAPAVSPTNWLVAGPR